MSIVISAVGFGLVTAAVTALAAVGFTLQVGISNVFNFSYGAIMITGTYIGYAVNHAGGGLQPPVSQVPARVRCYQPWSTACCSCDSLGVA